MKTRILLAIACLAAPVAASAADTPTAKSRITAVLDRNYPHLEAIYEDLHAHPEIAFHETRTAAVLARKMRKLGFDVTEKVGGTGIVALYRNGAGPTIMVRTELDGLPLEEKTGLPYASRYTQQIDGKTVPTMHACGHDVHMAWWLATAQALLAMKDRWHGTLMFVGQPAEEKISGAKAMLADGLFKRFGKPDYGFAAHVGPRPVGMVHIKEGAVSSASDAVAITFHGRGAHGSMPEKSIDPIVMGAHFVSDVQTIISREVDPAEFGVITVGAFNAGMAENIIPDHADLRLTLRSHEPEVRQQLLDGVARTAKAVATMAGAPAPDIDRLYGTAALRNDVGLARSVAKILDQAMPGKVTLIPETMPAGAGSEDFSEFVDAGVPSLFLSIGGVAPERLAAYRADGKTPPVNHSPLFAPDPEGAIRAGTMALTLAVLSVAGQEAQ